MFSVLLESNRRPARRRGVAAASVGLHVGLILLGVWATAESAPPTPRVDRETTLPDIFTQPAPTRSPEPPSQPASETAERPLPDVPTIPPLPVEVPNRLPPVSEPLGDPFARTYDSVRVAIDGIHRDGTRLAPRGVLDNRVVDKPALPLAGNRPPAYPDRLRSASIEGTVEVEFVIDLNGRFRPASLVALHADHPGFLESVRKALADHRYLPAEVGGTPVAVRVRQRFEFRLEQ